MILSYDSYTETLEKQKQKDNDIEELKRSVAFLADRFNAFLLSQQENKLIYYEDDIKNNNISDGRRLKGIALKEEIKNKVIGTVIHNSASSGNNKKK